MKGLWIHDARTSRFSDYAPSLLPEWDALWWLSGTQSGPITHLWLDQNEANEEFLAASLALKLHGEVFDYLWHSHSMQTLAPHLTVSEWSYFCGIEAPDLEEAKRRAYALNEHHLRNLPERVGSHAEILILDVDDGLLFIFSPRQDWLDAIATQWKDAQPITHLNWQKWLNEIDGFY